MKYAFALLVGTCGMAISIWAALEWSVWYSHGPKRIEDADDYNRSGREAKILKAVFGFALIIAAITIARFG